MFKHWRFRKRCRAAARQCLQPQLARYATRAATMRVDRIENTPIISVDLEMTGLDAEQNQIVAIGWTQLDGGRIKVGSNRHVLINPKQPVGHSAAIHELTDREVAGGVSLEAGLEALFEAALGRVWIFHHAKLDVAFLRRACMVWGGATLPFMVLDTMHMELELRKRRDLPVHHGDMQLRKLREKYNLPGYTAHNALIDACATAELLLAIAAHLDSAGSLQLRRHLRYP